MTFNKLIAVISVCMLLICMFVSSASANEEHPVTLRLDSEKLDGEVRNLRLLTKGEYKFKKLKEKYNLPSTYHPDETGLDTLDASASGQFSEEQFRELAKELRRVAKGKKIYIIDLRQECHGFLNGIPVSWYSQYNWDNYDKSLEWIEATEKERLKSLVGKQVTAYVIKSDEVTDKKVEIDVTDAKTERELVESEGFTYIRIPCTDHMWPGTEQIDQFFDFIRSVDRNDIWPHFHCVAGEGRTGIFISAYDTLKNQHVDPGDIVFRQSYLGNTYLLYQGDGTSWKDFLSYEKASYMTLLWFYIMENASTDFEKSWSDFTDSVNKFFINDPWEAVKNANMRAEWIFDDD